MIQICYILYDRNTHHIHISYKTSCSETEIARPYVITENVNEK